MENEEGDPRSLVPEFFDRFSWLERRLTVAYFLADLRSQGNNDSRRRAPASAARKAMILGSYAFFLHLSVYPCIAMILWSAIAGANLGIILAAQAGLFAVGIALGGLRHRQINRYFDGRL